MIAKWGGRKFVMTMGCGVVCTFLLWFEKIDQGAYQVLILATVGAYVGGNVAQKRLMKEP